MGESLGSCELDMTIDEALAILEVILQRNGRKTGLSDVQTLVFRQSWLGRSYREIADESDYEYDYIKQVGSQLWRQVSDAVGQPVSKSNIQSVLRRQQQVQIATQSTLAQPNALLATAPGATSCNQDWGEAINVSAFYGRTLELETLLQWIVGDRCRLVAILGMGGVGKSALSVRLAEHLGGQKEEEKQANPLHVSSVIPYPFVHVIWRSLRQAPPISDLLNEIILILSEQQVVDIPTNVGGQIAYLLGYLQQKRCLIVLDNVESILQSGERTGCYRNGYEGYGQLIERVGDERHQSCLVLTSREKPREIFIREGDTLSVRSLQLSGLPPPDWMQLLVDKGLAESKPECEQLVKHYSGNPLALKIAAATIQSLFGGNVNAFLTQGTAVFGDIWDLLNQQFDRLSDLEQRIMYWLAIAREWITLSELHADILPKASQRELLEAMQSLNGRSLLETSAIGFTQQPVVMEYVTERLVKQFFTDIREWKAGHGEWQIIFNSHALIKAQAKDYIREAQIRLILQPVKDMLLRVLEDKSSVEVHFDQILTTLRMKPVYQSGYAAGNLLNLYWQLQSDLNDRDFSHLTIRQAYLPNVTLHRTNFAYTTIDRSMFAETFGGVTSVAFSPNGKLLASSDTSGEIQIWQLPTGKQLIHCRDHNHWAWSVAFSPNGQFLASVSDDYLVKLWDVNTGECLKTFKGHTYAVNAVMFSPDGQWIATSGQDATIRLWDVNAIATPGNSSEGLLGVVTSTVRILQDHTSRVWSVAFSPDGKTLASCSEDLTIKLWDVINGVCRQTLQGHTKWVKSVAFSSDGQFLASGSFDCTMRLWDVQTGTCLKILQGHTNTITAVAISPDSQYLASSSYDQTVRLWAVETGQCIKMLRAHSNRVWSVVFSPDGQLLASGGDDHATKLWNVKTGQCAKTIKGHTNSVFGIAFSQDAEILVSGHEDQTIRLWNLDTGECVQTLYGHTNRVWSVAISSLPHLAQGNGNSVSHRVLLASGSADFTIKLWDYRTGQCLKTLQGHTSWVWAIAISPNGQHLASSSYDRTVKLWNIETGKCLRTFSGHNGPVVSVAFSPDGQWLASSSFDATIKLWDTNSEQCIRTLEGHKNSIWQVAFSPNGQQLASSSLDQTIKVWDFHTGECIQTLQGHNGAVACITYSANGQRLASGSFDRTIKLWNLATGDCIQTLHQHQGLVYSVLLHPSDDNTLFSSSFDETIKLWNLATGDCLRTLRTLRPYEQMNISGVAGLTEAQKTTLKALGAVEE